MKSNELLSVIANLETNLKDIDSARTQVSNTIAAYKDVHSAIDNYAKSLDKIPSNIAAMIDVVRLNQEVLNSKLSQDLKDKITDFELHVAHVKAVLDSASNNLANQCDNVLSNLENGVGTIVKTSENCLQRLDSSISDIAKVSSEIDQKLIVHKEYVEHEFKSIKTQNDLLGHNFLKVRNVSFILNGLILFLLSVGCYLLAIK